MAPRKNKTICSSKNTHSDSNVSSKIAIIVAVIGVFGTLGAAYLSYLSTKTQIELPIVATQTAEAKSMEKAALVSPSATLASSFTDTPTIVESTPTESFSNAIIVVNNYYDWINTATNTDDFLRSWHLETEGTNGMQCKETTGCDYSKFANFWWAWKTKYELYDCGSNIVHADVRYYLRDPLLVATPTAPYHIRFQLLEVNGDLKIDETMPIEGPGADCKLVISVP
jgi:hypothetical protein